MDANTCSEPWDTHMILTVRRWQQGVFGRMHTNEPKM